MKSITEEYSLLKATGNFFYTLPESLVSAEQLTLLRKAADFFPPFIRFGLECRLGEQEQVDLQLCIRRDEDDLDAVLNWFNYKFSDDSEQSKLLHFLKLWADKSTACHQSIPEIFLELDVLPSGIKTPLLFFELQPGLNESQRKEFCFSILNEIQGRCTTRSGILENIFNACTSQSYVGYIGIQFSRNTDVLRVNIKKLSVCSVIPFLQQIGYTEISPELEKQVAFVYNYANRVTLCLDAGVHINPKIGFECFWDD